MKHRSSGRKETISAPRIGLLGGTFDPPHIGHMLVANAAFSQLALDAVHFLPVGNPPHKRGRHITPAATRIAMVELAIADTPHFILDRTDADRAGPFYTATLLPILREQRPDATYYLIVGSDSVRDFHQWNRPNLILNQCQLAVMPRPGVTIDWDTLDATVPTLRERIAWLDGPAVQLSSTMLRQWSAAGFTLDHLTTPTVSNYITQNNLYL